MASIFDFLNGPDAQQQRLDMASSGLGNSQPGGVYNPATYGLLGPDQGRPPLTDDQKRSIIFGSIADSFDSVRGIKSDTTGQLSQQYAQDNARQQSEKRRQAINQALQTAIAQGDHDGARSILMQADPADVAHITQALQFGQPKFEQVDPTRDTVSTDPLTGQRTIISKGVPKATPNQPFNPDGSPNTAFQSYEQGKIKTQQAPTWANNALSRERLDFEKNKFQAGVPDDATLHDMATRFVNGDRQAAVGLGRNPATQMAFQTMVSQVGRERGMSQQQISGNLQTFQAGTKAVQAFDTGKQGDTTRSLNVSVAHLNSLKDLGEALQNGDVTLVNAAKQKFAEAFGVPAPTNFDAARAIVADEVAKGVIGGQTAQADREALAASLRRERSPQAINGAIGTFQDLLSGQLHGLRQQYKSSTGRDDFNDKLFPETITVLDKPRKAKAPPSAKDLPRLPGAPGTGKIRTYNPATGRLE